MQNKLPNQMSFSARKTIISFLFCLSFMVSPNLQDTSAEPRKNKINSESKLSLPIFIQKVIKNDPNFPVILIEELYLKYQKDLQLPASDIVLQISGQYDLFLPLNENNDNTKPWEGSISLSKLFPKTGTTISASYSNNLMSSQAGVYQKSSLGISLSQSIIQNAFGVLTRMQEKKIDIENKVARYQVIEAYEEYMASLIQIYLDWYATLENFKATRATLKYNEDLLRIIRLKRRYRIAFNEDIYKVELEVLIAQENLVELANQLRNKENRIKLLTGIDNKIKIQPQIPDIKTNQTNTNKILNNLNSMRTFRILKESKSQAMLAKDIAKRTLLPELDLFVGYQTLGQSYNLQNRQDTIYAGVTTTLNFGHQVETANYKTKILDFKKAHYNMNKQLFDLKIYIEDLAHNIIKQKKRIELARKKLNLAQKDIVRRNKKLPYWSQNIK